MLLTTLGQTEPAVGERAGTRMQQLRHATREAHQRIERALPLLDPSLSRAGYVRLLAAFYGFYEPLEPLCMAAAGDSVAALDLAARAKVPLLVADLGSLGHSSSDVRALPRCRNLPTVTSASQSMGALYVVEGATLGGQIIRRHLQGALGIDVTSGAAFFVGYGERTRQMWTLFAGHVDHVDGLELESAIGAALETFESLERWMIASLGST